MSERRTVREYVYPPRDGAEDLRPDKLPAFRDWLCAQIDSIPEPYQADASIDIGVDYAWGESSLEFSISYDRPETDEEMAARDAEACDRIERKRVYKGLRAQGVDHVQALARAEGRA